ncbi:uncharacterized protein LOC122422603 isoform X2 [Cervus canadensis]|uniref:uncharacterized protein LOC122422603 isoform X2 n=1 Tax=Cervus canadensis TaxID=1574408 RepID=UPI001CA31953|nr:uncharacterized protein LOC122422603 isoform X2 [Cervus canadensis]
MAEHRELNRTQNPGTQAPLREETPARSLAAKMFCCLPLPRGRGLGRAHRQSVWDRWRRWLRAPRGGLWPFARRNRKSFPPDVADEGDTPSTSSREGSEPHPPAREAQCRVQVSVPMEGSAQGGVKSKRGRPPQKPPRTHRGAQSRAASRLSTPGSDPEPRAPLPLRQHEDLEPSAAEHREVLAARAGPRDPLRGHRDLIHPASKTLDQLVPGHHTGQIGPLCLQDAQPQAPMSLPFGPNVHLHLHLHLLGLWQENPSQGMSYHLCRESLPWLLLNTQTPTMTDQPLQGQRAPLLDRDPEPVLETPGPGEPWALQPLSLSAPHGCHQLAPHPGETDFPSLEGLFIWFFSTYFVLFYLFYGVLYFSWFSLKE